MVAVSALVLAVVSRQGPHSLVISPDRPSTGGVLAFLWILHVFCLDYHQPICVSVCVGRKRQFTAWYIRHVRIIRFLWTKRTIWLLLLSFTQNIVRACSMFYPYEGYRSVTPLDAARVNRTIFHNHSVHWYYIALIRVGVILSTILM